MKAAGAFGVKEGVCNGVSSGVDEFLDDKGGGTSFDFVILFLMRTYLSGCPDDDWKQDEKYMSQSDRDTKSGEGG